MKRGPYKLYLSSDGNGIMPRSTFYDKLKKYRLDVVNENEHNLGSQKVSDDDSQLLMEAENDNLISPAYQRSQNLMNMEQNIFFSDSEDDEDIEEREQWFDAEDLPQVGNGCSDEKDEISDAPSNRHETDDCYNQPLCQCTSVTRGEALMMTLSLGAQESLTWKTITSILSMINTLFGGNVVPASKYKLFKTLELKNSSFSRHMYCNECFFYFGVQSTTSTDDFVCPNCDENFNPSNVPFFLTLDFANQLKQIFENSEIQEALLKRIECEDNEEGNELKDINDGKIYKKLLSSESENLLCNKYNFSYTFNTDGCQLAKSSKLSIWPIYITINELPPKLRSKNLIMTGIWVDKVEPDMNLFLKPFVDEANDLSKTGLQWKLGEQTITSKFIPLCACFDSVARCKVLNMKQYNGKYGCTFCEHPTESVNGYRKFPISVDVPVDRTDESIKNQMVLASTNKYKQDVKGVWGPSQLMNLNYFDLVGGMSPDYLHSILLGTIKQHTELLFSSFGKEYYIGNPNHVEIINEILLKFKHPSSITRSPRDINERNMWKATEWRSWLLFYSLPCLNQILPQKYLDHLALLVEAVTILLEEKITSEMLEIADELLIRYVCYYQEYFGKEHMTYNIHLLLHMVKSVMNLGPLSAHNTFCFENENHFVLKMKKSPTHVGLQITRKYFFHKSLPLLRQRFKLSEAFEKFCERNLSGRLKNTLTVGDCVLVGKGSKYNLSVVEKQAIDFASDECSSYNRLIYNRNRYTSESYRICQKINDTIIMLKNGNNGVITNICCFNNVNGKEVIIIFYREIKHTGKFFHSTQNVTVHNIHECHITDTIRACKPNSIIRPAILQKIGESNYIINIPKGCDGD
ncbi:GSCOCG00006713001-RA-CDS [Cotesia congregata]|nr:GSCOCG00006713001-RA-CDS [Cotesia congregata]